MPQLTSILILAPNGVIGSRLCTALLNHRHNFKRIAAFKNTDRITSPSKALVLSSLSVQGLEIISGSYTSVPAFTGFDTVIMPLGNHGLYLQPQIIDTAIAAGVRHFYPSEWGADLMSGDNAQQRYYKYKIMTREHLAHRAKEVDGLGWTLIQVGRLTEYSVSKPLGIDNSTREARVFGTKEGRQSLLSMLDSIAYTVRTLLDPAVRSGERNYRFHGESPSWDELFEALERVTRSKYRVTYLDVEDARAKEKKAMEMGDIEMELEASHQLIQGSGGTLLHPPFDNSRYPDVVSQNFEQTLEAAFADEWVRKWLLGI